MTKQRFLADVMRFVPRGASIEITTLSPVKWTQSTWAIVVECSCECFPTSIRHSGKSCKRYVEGARSRKSAEAKAAKYQRWVDEYLKKQEHRQ